MPEPTLTSKNNPLHPSVQKPPLPPVPPTSVEVEVPYDQIVAKPLRAPNFINLYPKNPNMTLYWGNKAVGEKESGMRFDQLIAMGFVPARAEDVYSRNPETGAKMSCPGSLVRDGRIQYGDVILLKIPRVDYIGAVKWNEQSARMRVKKPGVAIETGAKRDIGGPEVLKTSDGRSTPIAAGFPRKVDVFTPNLAEVDAATADNSGPEFNLADPAKKLPGQ